MPDNTIFYMYETEPEIWWAKEYLEGILDSTYYHALMFLQAKERWFALSFGHGYRALKEDSYIHDFGFIITLNLTDKKPLKLLALQI